MEAGTAGGEVAVVTLCALAAVALGAWLSIQLLRERHILRRRVSDEFQTQKATSDEPVEYVQSQQLPYDTQFEFPKARLHLGPELGRGQFGVVRRALAQGIVAGETATTVAVKMVRSDDAAVLKALATELKIMIHLGKHANIANLLGACTVDFHNKELLVILEFCELGSLYNVLRENHPEKFSSAGHIGTVSKCAVVSVGSVENTGRLSAVDLVGFAFQIARGMDFLTTRGVLHGDLAARNVLLAANNIVKICDFGLARSVDADGNYVKRHMTQLPLRWMAVESITQRVFSSQSDVWSFGVVLWELFSYAESPYSGMDAAAIIEKVVTGYRLPKPHNAPDTVYALMQDCWQALPVLRPSFADLAEALGALLDRAERQHLEDLNQPYECMNDLWRQQSGYTDYLAMLAASQAQSAALYANLPDAASESEPSDGRAFPGPPHAAVDRNDGADVDGYLPMKPLVPESLGLKRMALNLAESAARKT